MTSAPWWPDPEPAWGIVLILLLVTLVGLPVALGRRDQRRACKAATASAPPAASGDPSEAGGEVLLRLDQATALGIDELAGVLATPDCLVPSRVDALRRAVALARWVAEQQRHGGVVVIEDRPAGLRTELTGW